MESPIMIVMLVLIGLVMGGTNEMFMEMREKMIELNDRVMIAEQKLLETKKLEKEILKLRDAPYLHQCGYSLDAGQGSKFTITFDNLFYSSTNTEGGGLDIMTGVFTSPWPGTYTVSWGLYAEDNLGEDYVYIYLYKNGKVVQESLHVSIVGGNSYFAVVEQGTR